MPENEKEEAKSDADAGTLLSTAVDAVNALTQRIDAMLAADASKKADADKEKEEEEAKPKAVAADSEKEEEPKADKTEKEDDSTVFYHGNKAPKREGDSKKDEAEEKADEAKEEKMVDTADIVKRIDRVERMLPKQLTDSERASFSDAQARADAVFHAFGNRAPPPMEGEGIMAYRQRLTNALKTHSPTFKDANVFAIADDATFSAIEGTVYTDAMRAASSPATAIPGSLRAISNKSGGHEFITYVGDPAAWMNEFAGPVRLYATAINTPNAGNR